MSNKLQFDSLILWEDEDYIGVNKPPFIATLEDRNEPVNLLALAKSYSPDAQACHRLDKNTSGVLVFAKNPMAYRHLSLQFQNREVTKLYNAVCDGIHRFDSVMIDLPILKQNDGRVKISKSGGKPAHTRFQTIETFRSHTLVECQPVTGRMHQIRVHLASLGAPITGDELYGGKSFFLSSVKRGFSLKKFSEEQPLMKRMALHALKLTFKNRYGESITFEASYPKDMKALIRQLEATR
ncbi:RluA family pseudouridine synthase [Oscillatoria amoena NRMC-F 0135]|nr:RluA family pseudouridine synthase [Oscillatoria amoena NRMC-F 0135]